MEPVSLELSSQSPVALACGAARARIAASVSAAVPYPDTDVPGVLVTMKCQTDLLLPCCGPAFDFGAVEVAMRKHFWRFLFCMLGFVYWLLKGVIVPFVML